MMLWRINVQSLFDNFLQMFNANSIQSHTVLSGLPLVHFYSSLRSLLASIPHINGDSILPVDNLGFVWNGGIGTYWYFYLSLF